MPTTDNNKSTLGVTIRRWGFTLVQDALAANLDEAKQIIQEYFDNSNPSAALTYTFEAVVTANTGQRGEVVVYYGKSHHRAYQGQQDGGFNRLPLTNKFDESLSFTLQRNSANDPPAGTPNNYEDARREYFSRIEGQQSDAAEVK